MLGYIVILYIVNTKIDNLVNGGSTVVRRSTITFPILLAKGGVSLGTKQN